MLSLELINIDVLLILFSSVEVLFSLGYYRSVYFFFYIISLDKKSYFKLKPNKYR